MLCIKRLKGAQGCLQYPLILQKILGEFNFDLSVTIGKGVIGVFYENNFHDFQKKLYLKSDIMFRLLDAELLVKDIYLYHRLGV